MKGHYGNIHARTREELAKALKDNEPMGWRVAGDLVIYQLPGNRMLYRQPVVTGRDLGRLAAGQRP